MAYSPGKDAGYTIDRSVVLNFMGDWGLANFHRICSWLCQEFCDRAGRRSRVAIWSWRDGGLEALCAVEDGEADLCIATPAMLMPAALEGSGMFAARRLSRLRALAVLPQNDRLVLAIDGNFGIRSFAELRAKRPPLQIATSANDGTSFIGWVAAKYMEAHGIDAATLRSWGGSYVVSVRPEQSLFLMRDGASNAVLQEAIMTPWWRDVIDGRGAIPLPAEPEALSRLEARFGYRRNFLPAGYWDSLHERIETLDFSDFVIIVRDDMPVDIARLLTWCLVETRENLERQFRHIPVTQSPLTYPLNPGEMSKVPIALHPGAHAYYAAAGLLAGQSNQSL